MRNLRRVLLFLASLAVALALAIAIRSVVRVAVPIPSPEEGNELVALVLPGPVLYFPGPDGAPIGFDADLIRLYAAQRKLPLRFVTEDSPAELTDAIARAQAHVGLGGLFRPLAAGGSAGMPATPRVEPRADILWTVGLLPVEPVLIYNREGFRPADWRDLEGEVVAYLDSAGLDPEIDALRQAHPDVKWAPVAFPSPAGLIAQVSDGTVGYAIVSSLAAVIARNVYLDFEVAFVAGGKREIAWAVPGRFAALRADLDAFLERAKRDGTIARLLDRYAPAAPQFQRVDASGLMERLDTLLPPLRPLFHEAQERTGVEWRLLAALAFQESKWDRAATSETGVRGIMQITEDTARHLGIDNPTDPRQNIAGAARYLADLKMRMPPAIREPDRTWFALAAYNIGLGHLEDARTLAARQKLNANLWSDVKKVLPLLALPEYYTDAKNGYARGGMPVAFVDRVRGYYDLLLAHESPHQPRLRTFADSFDRARGPDGSAATR